MKILAVADTEAKYYYDFYMPGRLDGIDLILACGDLRREYLEFLATLAHGPLVYVRGNHDDSFHHAPPEGCVCADGRLIVCQGVRILGLGGSYRYRDGSNMYTERQMRRRIAQLRVQLWRQGGFDILLAHAPARHMGDLENLPHRGFACFTELMDRYQPRYFVHGHIHREYGVDIPQRTSYGATTIINAYSSCVFSY